MSPGLYCILFFFRKQKIVTATAEIIREIRDGYATPAAPNFRAKTPMQLPTTFITLAAIDMYIVTLVLPMLRQSAAPASYTASAGSDTVVIIR